jgi:TolB protein
MLKTAMCRRVRLGEIVPGLSVAVKKPNFVLLLFLLILPLTRSAAQPDWIRTGTNRGAPIRLAAPDFKVAGADPQISPLNSAFNETLWNDLDNAGIFDMVARSYYPLLIPGNPGEMKLPMWANPPANAAMVAFGHRGVAGGKV